MKKTKRDVTSNLIFLLIVSVAIAQGQTPIRPSTANSSEVLLTSLLAQVNRSKRPAFSLVPSSRTLITGGPVFNITPMAAGPNLTVLGGGTLGRLTKWTGFTSSNSFIGDSTIFESKTGLVGIGTDSPTSKLTVAGMIESASGGFQFPDGSVQTTAGVAQGDVVSSLNALKGDLTLGEGSNIRITPAGSTITIGVKIPLVLSGSVPADGVIQVTNTALGSAISAKGATVGSAFLAGVGVIGAGGNNASGGGGIGVLGRGGSSDSGNGGSGLAAEGGPGIGAGNRGGHGIEATAGTGSNGAAQGLAGKFNGNVQVTGTLSKGGGSFKIDHPLDPENRYLYHSFVESPDMMNIYNGNITTNKDGEAVVLLPDYFGALNRDFRYQLTVIGSFAQAIIADEIKGNSFTIKTDAPNVKVSWQVTGIRQDAFANKNRIPTEEDKPDVERGYYLHPEAFDLSKEKSINSARHSERAQQLNHRRREADQSHKQ